MLNADSREASNLNCYRTDPCFNIVDKGCELFLEGVNEEILMMKTVFYESFNFVQINLLFVILMIIKMSAKKHDI